MLKKYKDWSPTSHDTKGLAAGDKGEWLVAPCLLTRDRDALERSNYASQAKTLQAVNAGAESDTEELRFTHWAYGWLEVTLVRPGSPAAKEAQALADRLEVYPVLNEELWSEYERADANEVWQCYTTRERIAYVREYRSDFEFRSFADMLACCRGKYFAGDAGELLR